MAKRKIDFFKDEYYHIFNRGVDKRKIFLDKGDLYYFFDTIQISNKKNPIEHTNGKKRRKKEKEKSKHDQKLVDIIAYSFLPNHYHFILRERVEGGITKFMQKLGTSYTMYFNSKYKRSGSLFQGKFKANHLDDELSRELTSAYVNLNYKHHNYDIKKDLIKTSLFEYLDEEKGEKICNEEEIKSIIKTVGSIEKYKKYLKTSSKHFTERHKNDSDILNFDELE